MQYSYDVLLLFDRKKGMCCTISSWFLKVVRTGPQTDHVDEDITFFNLPLNETELLAPFVQR